MCVAVACRSIEQIGNMLSVGMRWSDETTHTPDLLSGSDSAFKEQARQLRVVAIQDPPYTAYKRLSNGSYHFEGYLVDIWEIIAQRLNLRYKIEPLVDGGYGNMDENGTWSGMVGELAYGRADVMLSWLYLRPDRTAVVDFIDSVAVESVKETFYIQQRSGDASVLTKDLFQSLLKPLGTSVWWALIASMLVLSVVLRVIIRAGHAKSERRQTVTEMTWSSCLLSSFMTLVGQGWARTPDSLAARTVTIFSWMLGIVIYASYTTNLISHLTVVTVDRPIASLKEFSESSDWILAMQPGHGVLNDWKLSRDVYLKMMYEQVIARSGFLAITTSQESINKLAQPNVMAYTSTRMLFSLLGNRACKMVTLEEPATYQTSSGFLAMAQGMPTLHAAIDKLLTKLHELGVLWRLKWKWVKDDGAGIGCDSEEDSHALSVIEFLPVLVVAGLGLVVSVLLLVAELMWYMFNRAPRRSWSLSHMRLKNQSQTGRKRELLAIT